MNTSFEKWLASESYQQQKEKINREVNAINPINGYAHLSFQSPRKYIIVDRKAFKQTPEQKGAAYAAKAYHRESLRKAYGTNWKKHLNIPVNKLTEPIKMSF